MPSPFTMRLRAPHASRAILRLWPGVALTTLAGLLALPALAANDNAAPLTLGKAQLLAVSRSRQLAAQDLAVQSSHEMASAAGQLPDPVLKFGVDNLPVSGADRLSLTNDFMTMRRVGLMQEITREDKLRARTERYERATDKSLAEKSVATAAIERDAALAWLDRYYAERMAAAIAEQVLQAQLEVQAAESAYRGGRGSQADVFSARSTLAALDDRASELQKKVRNAKTVLERWVGAAAEAQLAGTPAWDTIRLDPATLDTDLAHHPQIAVFDRQTDIAQADARVARADKSADWSVELTYQQRGPAYSNMVSVGVSIPLQWDQKHRQDRELSAKLAMVEEAKAEREEALRQYVAETRTMIDEWKNDRERGARYEHELLPLASQRTQVLLAAYRGGKASLTDLLSARRAEIDIRLQSLQLQADTARLWAQLNFLAPSSDLAPISRPVPGADTTTKELP